MAVFHLEESEIVLVQEMMDEIKTEVEDILSQPVSFKALGNFSKRWFLSRNISSISNPNVICAGMPKDFKLYKEILFSPSMHPKFHPNRSTRI